MKSSIQSMIHSEKSQGRILAVLYRLPTVFLFITVAVLRLFAVFYLPKEHVYCGFDCL